MNNAADEHPQTAVAPMTGGQRGIIRGVHAGHQRPSAPVLFELAVNTAGLSCQTDRLVRCCSQHLCEQGGGHSRPLPRTWTHINRITDQTNHSSHSRDGLRRLSQDLDLSHQLHLTHPHHPDRIMCSAARPL